MIWLMLVLYFAIGFVLFGMYMQTLEDKSEAANGGVAWTLIVLWPTVICVWIGAEIVKRIDK